VDRPAAHLRENGRIVVMFCAFAGPPQIVRLHGKGELIAPSHPRYPEFEKLFPVNPGTRAYVHVRIDRVSDSCGFSVPLYEFRAQRDTLNRWALARTADQLAAYRLAQNRYSIDGLAALPMAVEAPADSDYRRNKPATMPRSQILAGS